MICEGCALNAKLSLQQVTKIYDQNNFFTTVFDEISYEFLQGSCYALVGASGSGKSTLIHLLAGVDRPTRGDILFAGKSITSFSQKEMMLFLQKNISLVFQQAALFAELTVLENVMLKAILAGSITKQSYQHAHDLLEQVGLANKAYVYPEVLSGGQQQRVAILRAIFVIPDFLLVDEPTGNLDEQAGDSLIDLLLTCQKEYGMGLILSTHNNHIAQRMDYIIKVESKKLVSVL